MKVLVIILLCAFVSISAAQSLTDNAAVAISTPQPFGRNTIKTYVLDDENVFVIRVGEIPRRHKMLSTSSVALGAV